LYSSRVRPQRWVLLERRSFSLLLQLLIVRR
jgi:hypothetical protein